MSIDTNKGALPNAESETLLSDGPEQTAAAFCLSVFVGERAQTYALPPSGTISLGRSSSCDVRLDDPSVSRVHALLRISDRIHLCDEGSSNGTRVNHVAISPGVWTEIEVNVAINVGTVLVIVRPKEASARPRTLLDHSQLLLSIEQEHARCARRGTAFALLRFDANNRLQRGAVENSCAAVLRTSDVFGRLGPGQYAVLLVDVGPAHAVAAANRIMSTLVDVVGCNDDELRHAVVCFPRDAQSPDALMQMADSALSGVSTAGASINTLASWNAGLQGELSRIAGSNLSVLLIGETGVGKEVFASLLHQMSPRAEQKMVRLNCAAIAENLLEAELFGFEKGAFTGADKAKPGLLESADQGTVFLDEIGEMPLATQVKLLRVLETREVQRIGAIEPRSIDVRFLAATNRDLEAEVLAGRFRRDLLFRINAVTLRIPPLRQRVDEIEPLAHQFAAEAARQLGAAAPALTEPALRELKAYQWPGNVRELRNVIERAVVLSGGAAVQPDHLPLDKFRSTMLAQPVTRTPAPGGAGGGDEGVTVMIPRDQLDDEEAQEKQRIVEALEACSGNQTKAARLLGVSRGTLVSRLDRYNIPRPRKPTRRR